MDLQEAWRERLRLYAEKEKLYTRAKELWNKGIQFRIEARKLQEAGRTLCTEGNSIWIDALWEAHDSTLRWQKRGGVTDCYLISGKIFLGDEPI